MQQSRAVDDDVVKIILSGDDLQKQRVDHKYEKRHRSVDDRHADQAACNEPAGSIERPIRRERRGILHEKNRCRLPHEDGGAERQREQMRKVLSLSPEHDDPVMDQEKRDDEKRDRHRDEHGKHGAAHVVPEQAENKRDHAQQREKQQIAVAVTAPILLKAMQKHCPEADRE